MSNQLDSDGMTMLRNELATYEKMYDMQSADVYRQYMTGVDCDDVQPHALPMLDYIDWVGAYELVNFNEKE